MTSHTLFFICSVAAFNGLVLWVHFECEAARLRRIISERHH